MTKGIWASGILKHDMMLWRARWRKITTNLGLDNQKDIEHTNC